MKSAIGDTPILQFSLPDPYKAQQRAERGFRFLKDPLFQQTFPSQAGKPVTNPTARWIFQCLTGIPVLLLDGQAAMILNLNARHLLIIELLGQPY